VSSEYRFWVIPRGFLIPFTRNIRVERVGLALFYEAGGVASNISNIFKERARHSYGIGIRGTLERTAPFRVDFGFSKEDMQIIAGLGLPF
jgi:outer membrane protein assembly factor BamA